MKVKKYINLRVGFWLLLLVIISGGLVYRYSIVPADRIKTNEEYIGTYIKMSSDMLEALNTYEKALQELQPPTVIEPRQSGSAKTYSENLLNSYKSVLGIASAPLPKQAPYATFPKAQYYNKIITDSGYILALKQARKAHEDSTALFGYHYTVMNTLVNFLQYDPKSDIKTGEATQTLATTLIGLQTSIDKLGAVPPYSDSSLQEIRELIEEVKQACEELQKQYEQGTGPSHEQKNEYIKVTEAAQKQIIKNRGSFWTSQKTGLLSQTSDAIDVYSPFVMQLQ